MTASQRIRQARNIRDSREYGWQVISRAEYAKLLVHDYAGPDGENSYWVLSMDETGATCLYKGVTFSD